MKISNPLVFVSLGPSGSNHEFVTRQYLKFHKIENYSTIILVTEFDKGANLILSGEADFMIQVAVHPDTARITATYINRLFVIDAFVSPSKEMAIITRKDVGVARTLALQPATKEYVDTHGLTLIPEVSVGSVAEGLLNGTYESGLTYASLADENPTQFRNDHHIGAVDDAWLVYGRTRTSGGQLISWNNSPALNLFLQELSNRAR